MNDSRPTQPERRWYQFSLRSLLIVVLVLGVFFGWLGSRLQRARVNRQAMAELHSVEAEIASKGGVIGYKYAEQRPNWLEQLLGDPGMFDVLKVGMGRATDDDLKHLKDLEGMLHSWELDLSCGSDAGLTDAGLMHLKGLTGLRNLNLTGQWKITDAGLEHLEGLASLRVLRLDYTAVSPVGVSNLEKALQYARITPSSTQLAAIAEIEKVGGRVDFRATLFPSVSFTNPHRGNVTDAVMLQIMELANLRERIDVYLHETSITDAGLVRLRSVNVGHLWIGHTQVTDAGMEHIGGMSGLQDLNCFGNRITDVGVEHIKGLRSLTTLGLAHTEVTDAGLEHLKGLTTLRYLDLRSTKVTNAGVEKLQEALPDCKIQR